ncbi:hypothetical protein FKM82_030877 [Ascaphus truei]
MLSSPCTMSAEPKCSAGVEVKCADKQHLSVSPGLLPSRARALSLSLSLSPAPRALLLTPGLGGFFFSLHVLLPHQSSLLPLRCTG